MYCLPHEIPILTAEFVASLAMQYGVPSDKIATFHERLEGAAQSFKRNQETMKAEGPTDARRKRIKRLSRATRDLRLALSETTDDVWCDVSRASSIVNSAPYTARIYYADRAAPEFDGLDHVTFDLPTPLFRTESIELGLTSLLELLDVLDEATATIDDHRPPPRKGPSDNWPLRECVRGIRAIWREVLQRKFTRDAYEDGEPITDAARFCDDIFKLLAPEIPRSRIQHEMKLRIKEDRKTPFWNSTET